MGEARGLRALAAAVVVAVCGCGAHLLAGGQVDAWVAPLVLAAAFPVAYAAAGERLGTGQLLGLLVLGQVVVHALAGHVGTQLPAMLTAHAVATAVSLLLVRRGEDVWWRVADALVACTTRLVPVVAQPPPRRPVHRAAAEPWFPVLQVLVTGVGERAPPAGA